MKYTDLIFDLYGTLVDIHTDETDMVWQECAHFFVSKGVNIDGKTLKERHRQIVLRREGSEGQSYECYPDVPFDEVLEEILVENGVAKGARDVAIEGARLFRQRSTEYIRCYPHVFEALDRFREQGRRLWLLSNAQQVFTWYELVDLGLDKVFDGIYISSNYGCRKPDARFYNALIEEQNLEVESCLMIGNDRDTDIAGAKALGMATLYMHTALTPYDQKEADENLHPLRCDGRHFEYEGEDWQDLASIIEKM